MAVSEVSDDERLLASMSADKRGEYVARLREDLAAANGAWYQLKSEKDDLVLRHRGEVSQLLREVAALRSEVARLKGGSTWFGRQKRVEMLVARLHGDV